jgi:predicted esterase
VPTIKSNSPHDGMHRGLPIHTAGAPLAQAQAVMILLHGRGAAPRDILLLAEEWPLAGVAYLAPEAANSTWYPNRFIAPVATNEPWLTSALGSLDDAMQAAAAAGIAPARTILLGFSQGGCLALEYAARHPQRYGGVAGLSAGLIENGDKPREYTGSLAGTPVFLGCSDVDFHIALARVERTAAVLAALGGDVDKRIYPNMGHTVNRDEIEAVRHLLASVVEG